MTHRKQWEKQAASLKSDGYTSATVARKMIQIHGMPEADAEALVGRLYGKKVSHRTGDTTGAVVTGLALAAVGFGATATLFVLFGITALKLVPVYLALLGIGGKGLSQVIIALVNAEPAAASGASRSRSP